MSLADELLADLEENDNEDLNDTIKEEFDDGDEATAELSEKIFKPSANPMEVDVKVQSVRELCKLRDSHRLQNILGKIEDYAHRQYSSPESDWKLIEFEPKYRLVDEANAIGVEIDNEISIIHKFTKDKYQKRFPELDSLIVGEMEYLLAVRELGNELDQVKNNKKLQALLTQATIMIVSVTASTTQGTNLTPSEKAQIDEACEMAFQLNNYRSKIYDYVDELLFR